MSVSQQKLLNNNLYASIYYSDKTSNGWIEKRKE